MSAGGKCFAVVGVVVAIAILIIALVATSLGKLSSKEVGLKYNTIQKELGSEIFTEGLHTGPPGFEFIKFPNIFTSQQYNRLQCLNKDGLNIKLDVSYQFRIQMTRMREIVMQFKDFEGYEKVLNYVGIAALHESCSYFNTSDFQARRGAFEGKISEILTERYAEMGSDVEGLQVNNIQRPSSYEQAIQQKARAEEDISVAEQEEPRKVTEANTEKREAESEAQIIRQKAESNARILEKEAESEAEAILSQYEIEANAYMGVIGKDGLQFTKEGFISYLGVRVISDAKNPVYIGLDSPAKSSLIKK